MAMRRFSSLDRVFRALADGTRRSMIHALARGQARSAGELGRRFRSAQPTISRHLKVLERADLAHEVAAPRLLDLDDLCAHLAEQPGAERRRDTRAQVEDTQTLEGPAHDTMRI